MTRKRHRILTLVVCVQALVAPAAASAERSVIGHSVQGRPIVSIRSGPPDAPLKVLVVGAIHGDEPAGVRIARKLIAAGPPPRVALTVIPSVNPDGLAAGTRGNADGVDLNRNFPFDWLPLTGGEYSGPRPLSEPESRAAYSLIRRTRPDLTIWFHQPFGLIDRPEGNPFAARRFADLIGLPLHRLPGRYPGSAIRWQHHAFPTMTAFVAELPSHVSITFIRRSTQAVRQLASELASPALAPNPRVAP